eukprot:6185042-Pleurochrysis_carterae.AAC.2
MSVCLSVVSVLSFGCHRYGQYGLPITYQSPESRTFICRDTQNGMDYCASCRAVGDMPRRQFAGFSATVCETSVKLVDPTQSSIHKHATGCGSLWDEFWTSTDPLARVPCCYSRFRASDSIQNDLKRHAELILSDAAGTLARIQLNTTLLMPRVVPV